MFLDVTLHVFIVKFCVYVLNTSRDVQSALSLRLATVKPEKLVAKIFSIFGTDSIF